MRNYIDLNEQEKIHYASAAQLTSVHYLYPLMLQDLVGIENLEAKYLQVISKATLSYKTPYGLKANLEKLEQALREQRTKGQNVFLADTEPGAPLHPIHEALRIAASWSIYWKSPSIWGIGHDLNHSIVAYCLKYPVDELERLSQTFMTIHEWYYNWLAGQAEATTDYLVLLDVPQIIGRGYPVTLATNPDVEHVKKISETSQVLARFNAE